MLPPLLLWPPPRLVYAPLTLRLHLPAQCRYPVWLRQDRTTRVTKLFVKLKKIADWKYFLVQNRDRTNSAKRYLEWFLCSIPFTRGLVTVYFLLDQHNRARLDFYELKSENEDDVNCENVRPSNSWGFQPHEKYPCWRCLSYKIPYFSFQVEIISLFLFRFFSSNSL